MGRPFKQPIVLLLHFRYMGSFFDLHHVGMSPQAYIHVIERMKPIIDAVTRYGEEKTLHTRKYKIPTEERIVLFLLTLRDFGHIYQRAMTWNWAKSSK